jgi:hypothetical protein
VYRLNGFFNRTSTVRRTDTTPYMAPYLEPHMRLTNTTRDARSALLWRLSISPKTLCAPTHASALFALCFARKAKHVHLKKADRLRIRIRTKTFPVVAVAYVILGLCRLKFKFSLNTPPAASASAASSHITAVNGT